MHTLTELVYANPKAKQQAMAMSLTQQQHQHQHHHQHQYHMSHHLVPTEMFHANSNSNKKTNSKSSKGYLSNHMVMASNSSSSASHESSPYPSSSSMSSSSVGGLYDLQSQTIMQSQSMSVYQTAYLSNNNNTHQPNHNLLLPSSSSSSNSLSFSGYDTNTSLSMMATVGHPFENTPFPIHAPAEGAAYAFGDHQLRDENSNLMEFSASEAIVFNHQQQHPAINLNHPSMRHEPNHLHLQMQSLLSHQLMAPSSTQQHQHSAKDTQQKRAFHQQQQHSAQHHFHNQHQHHHPYHQYPQSSNINQPAAGPSEEAAATADVVQIGLSPSMPSTSKQIAYFGGPSTSSSSASPPMVLAEHQSCMISMQQNNSRESRNLAEKNRREKLNGYVQKLANCVPHVQDSTRRVDKTGVLRFAAHGLRLEYVFGSSMHQHTVDEEMAETLLAMVDSFLIVVNMRGHVVMVSENMEQQMGHAQLDMLGQNILNFTHPADRPHVRKAILPDELDTIFDIVQPVEGLTREEVIEDQLESDRRRFTFRFARAGPRADATQYEFVRWEGCFRSADSAPRGGQPDHPYPAGLQLSRRARTRDDFLPTHVNGNDVVFVAGMHVIKPPSLRDRLRDACRFEYKTRHLIDGRIVQCDQRISLVAGYMADEVCGLSPFTFMHRADVRWVMIALRQMYESFDVTGESCYRLISRTGRFIYLRTEGFMEVGNSNFISSFVCRNTLMPDDEGERLLGVMKEQFSMYVKEMEDAAARDALMPHVPGAIKYPTLMAAPMEEQERDLALQQLDWQAQAVRPAGAGKLQCAPQPALLAAVKQEQLAEAETGNGNGVEEDQLPLDILMPILPQDSTSHEEPVTDREIGTMVAGIHSMLRGLPIAEIATTAIENHHLRDLPSDAALADIHRRRRELKTIFKYGMPDKQQTLVSVQRSMFVIHRSHLVSDDSGADSGGELFNDPLPSHRQTTDEPVASCSYSSSGSSTEPAAVPSSSTAKSNGAAAAAPSHRIGLAASSSSSHHHHPQAGRSGDLSPTRACQLTDASQRRLLGTEQRITQQEKTENYRNLLSSSKVRLMESVHHGDPFPLSPSSSVASMPSPAVSCSSTEHECAGGEPAAVANELVARTKCTAKSRSPSLVAGRQREFCSDVGGFRPEVFVRSDEWSLRNPRIKSKKPRRVEMKRRAACGVTEVLSGSGVEEQLQLQQQQQQQQQLPSSSKRLAIDDGLGAAGPQPVPCGSQRVTTVSTTADYGRIPAAAAVSQMASRVPPMTATSTASPYLQHPALNTATMATAAAAAAAASQHLANATILARNVNPFGPHATVTAAYEDSLGDRLSEAGSDLSQMLSPASVGSMVHEPALMFCEPVEDGDLDDLVIGQDLLLSTINNDMSPDPPQSIVKQDYQVIYMPQHKHNGNAEGSGSSSGLQIDAHTTHPSISVELDDVDDLCEVPR